MIIEKTKEEVAVAPEVKSSEVVLSRDLLLQQKLFQWKNRQNRDTFSI
jgi:hypothetical protein